MTKIACLVHVHGHSRTLHGGCMPHGCPHPPPAPMPMPLAHRVLAAVTQEEVRTLRLGQTASNHDLHAKKAELLRLQRLLDEANARASAATAAAASAAGGARAAAHADGSGPAASDAERWATRLAKAERALEGERGVSGDLRRQLAEAQRAAEQGRAALQRMQQLEESLEEQPQPGDAAAGAEAAGAGAGAGARPSAGGEGGARGAPLAPYASDPLPPGTGHYGQRGSSSSSGSRPQQLLSAASLPAAPGALPSPRQPAVPLAGASVPTGRIGSSSSGSGVVHHGRLEDQISRLKDVSVFGDALGRGEAAGELPQLVGP